MYPMKKIIDHCQEVILPKCMYFVKNPNDSLKADTIDLEISNQVMKFLKTPNKKMAELEQRQDQLLNKIDILYDRIKTISSYCKLDNEQNVKSANPNAKTLPAPDEVVLVANSENLPWYLNVILKKATFAVNITWHIHSSVPNEKVPKIKAFVSKLINNKYNPKINLRLIFKNGESELKLSSLSTPILGNVNILRYLSFVYPSIIPYDCNDYYVDTLLDICHILEKTPEKNKDALINKLFTEKTEWISGSSFSVVDLAAYNVIKQWKNVPKSVPKTWFEKCEKLCL